MLLSLALDVRPSLYVLPSQKYIYFQDHIDCTGEGVYCLNGSRRKIDETGNFKIILSFIILIQNTEGLFSLALRVPPRGQGQESRSKTMSQKLYHQI